MKALGVKHEEKQETPGNTQKARDSNPVFNGFGPPVDDARTRDEDKDHEGDGDHVDHEDSKVVAEAMTMLEREAIGKRKS